MLVVALIVLIAWLYLTFGRGGYWRFGRWSAKKGEALSSELSIVAVVPARNEADVVACAIRSLLSQNLPQPLRVVLVDDNSTDGTAKVAASAAASVKGEDRLTIINGSEPNAGWKGKLWALEQGVEASRKWRPDFLLFTDADILHNPQTVAALAGKAQKRNLDLASYMVTLATATLAERLLIPAFVYFFFQLYPPAYIADERRSTAGAAGGCILIRPDALARAGGLGSIRSTIIDDCALAQIVKRCGGRVSLELTHDSVSLRSYGGFEGVGRMIARSAFFQLGHSYWLLAATVAGLALLYCAPPVLLLSSTWTDRVCGAAAWLLMSLTFLPAVRFYRQPWWMAFFLPVVSVFYGAATMYSAYLYVRGRGGTWKGRAQDIRSGR